METKPDATTDKTAAAAKKRPSPKLEELGEGIPVKQITFARDKVNCTLPDGTFGMSLIKSGKGEVGEYVLSWFPQVRGIRVEFTPRNQEKAGATFFVHESWCIWEV
jgi:hypothetical protein